MPGEINQQHATIIDEEVLRSRVRELTVKPEVQPRSAFSRFSANPLASLLVGFILTGIVGSSLTYYYTERQKQNEAARQSHEKLLETQRNKEAQDMEFLRKQNLLEIENNQHLNAQALEAQRAKDMRATEAARAARERDLEYARSQINVVEDRKIEQAKLLEVFIKYVNSDDPSQRTFGYEMFVSFGRGDLATRLISQKGDPAGRSTLIEIQNNSAQGETTRQLASRGLAKISDVQLKRILAVVSVFTTGRADGRISAKSLEYSRGGTLIKPFETYLAHPEAKYKDEVRPYLARMRSNDSRLDDEPAYNALTEKLENDSVMTVILENQFREAYLNPSLQLADQLGVKTVLGLATLFDASVNQGTNSTKRFSDRASQQLNGSPNTGVDEKVWIKVFLEMRKAQMARSSFSEAVKKSLARRADFFLTQAEKNNWDLLPPFEIAGRSFDEVPG